MPGKSSSARAPRDDKGTRWWVLGLISLSNLGSYYVYDAIAPVADLLHRQLGFSYADVGSLNAIYSLPNIFIALHRLGATLGLMTILQNIGMAAANVIVGWLNDQAHAGLGNPSGYLPMIWFFGVLSLVGTLIGSWLWSRPAAPAPGPVAL